MSVTMISSAASTVQTTERPALVSSAKNHSDCSVKNVGVNSDKYTDISPPPVRSSMFVMPAIAAAHGVHRNRLQSDALSSALMSPLSVAADPLLFAPDQDGQTNSSGIDSVYKNFANSMNVVSTGGYRPQVEAISPTDSPEQPSSPVQEMNEDCPKDKFVNSTTSEMQARHDMDNVQRSSDEQPSTVHEKVEAKPVIKRRTISRVTRDTDDATAIRHIFKENRLKAKSTYASLTKLLHLSTTRSANSPTFADEHGFFGYHDAVGNLPAYNQPSDTGPDYYVKSKESNESQSARIFHYFRQRREAHESKLVEATDMYNRTATSWTAAHESTTKSLGQTNSGQLSHTEIRELFHKTFPDLKRQRGRDDKCLIFVEGASNEDQAINSIGAVRSDAEIEDVIERLQEQEMEQKKMHAYAVVPPALLPHERQYCLVNNNGLLYDPASLMFQQRKLSNGTTWSPAETEIFRDKFVAHPKNFGLIAQALEKRTVSDCVHYYYMSKKTENYKALLRRSKVRRGGRRAAASSAIETSSASCSNPKILNNGLMGGVLTRRQRYDNTHAAGWSTPASGRSTPNDGNNGTASVEAGNDVGDAYDDDDDEVGGSSDKRRRTGDANGKGADRDSKTVAVGDSGNVPSGPACPISNCSFVNLGPATKGGRLKLRNLPRKLSTLAKDQRDAVKSALGILPTTKKCCSSCFTRISEKINDISEQGKKSHVATDTPAVDDHVKDVEPITTPTFATLSATDVDVLKRLLTENGKDWPAIATGMSAQLASEGCVTPDQWASFYESHISDGDSYGLDKCVMSFEASGRAVDATNVKTEPLAVDLPTSDVGKSLILEREMLPKADIKQETEVAELQPDHMAGSSSLSVAKSETAETNDICETEAKKRKVGPETSIEVFGWESRTVAQDYPSGHTFRLRSTPLPAPTLFGLQQTLYNRKDSTSSLPTDGGPIAELHTSDSSAFAPHSGTKFGNQPPPAHDDLTKVRTHPEVNKMKSTVAAAKPSQSMAANSPVLTAIRGGPLIRPHMPASYAPAAVAAATAAAAGAPPGWQLHNQPIQSPVAQLPGSQSLRHVTASITSPNLAPAVLRQRSAMIDFRQRLRSPLVSVAGPSSQASRISGNVLPVSQTPAAVNAQPTVAAIQSLTRPAAGVNSLLNVAGALNTMNLRSIAPGQAVNPTPLNLNARQHQHQQQPQHHQHQPQQSLVQTGPTGLGISNSMADSLTTNLSGQHYNPGLVPNVATAAAAAAALGGANSLAVPQLPTAKQQAAAAVLNQRLAAVAAAAASAVSSGAPVNLITSAAQPHSVVAAAAAAAAATSRPQTVLSTSANSHGISAATDQRRQLILIQQQQQQQQQQMVAAALNAITASVAKHPASTAVSRAPNPANVGSNTNSRQVIMNDFAMARSDEMRVRHELASASPHVVGPGNIRPSPLVVTRPGAPVSTILPTLNRTQSGCHSLAVRGDPTSDFSSILQQQQKLQNLSSATPIINGNISSQPMSALRPASTCPPAQVHASRQPNSIANVTNPSPLITPAATAASDLTSPALAAAVAAAALNITPSSSAPGVNVSDINARKAAIDARNKMLVLNYCKQLASGSNGANVPAVLANQQLLSASSTVTNSDLFASLVDVAIQQPKLPDSRNRLAAVQGHANLPVSAGQTQQQASSAASLINPVLLSSCIAVAAAAANNSSPTAPASSQSPAASLALAQQISLEREKQNFLLQQQQQQEKLNGNAKSIAGSAVAGYASPLLVGNHQVVSSSSSAAAAASAVSAVGGSSVPSSASIPLALRNQIPGGTDPFTAARLIDSIIKDSMKAGDIGNTTESQTVSNVSPTSYQHLAAAVAAAAASPSTPSLADSSPAANNSGPMGVTSLTKRALDPNSQPQQLVMKDLMEGAKRPRLDHYNVKPTYEPLSDDE